METRNQKSLTALGVERGSFDVVANKNGNHCAIFDDGTIVYISSKAWELMQSSQDATDFQYAEIKCDDGSWCPTIMPRNKANVLLHFSL